MKSTLIRSLNPELYKKFKAIAVLRGITLSEAFNEAMKLWIEKYEGILIKSKEDYDNEFFEQIKGELDKKYKGKYVLIANKQVIAVTNSVKEAYKILAKFDLRKCLIYKVGEVVEKSEWL